MLLQADRAARSADNFRVDRIVHMMVFPVGNVSFPIAIVERAAIARAFAVWALSRQIEFPLARALSSQLGHAYRPP